MQNYKSYQKRDINIDSYQNRNYSYNHKEKQNS